MKLYKDSKQNSPKVLYITEVTKTDGTNLAPTDWERERTLLMRNKVGEVPVIPADPAKSPSVGIVPLSDPKSRVRILERLKIDAAHAGDFEGARPDTHIIQKLLDWNSVFRTPKENSVWDSFGSRMVMDDITYQNPPLGEGRPVYTDPKWGLAVSFLKSPEVAAWVSVAMLIRAWTLNLVGIKDDELVFGSLPLFFSKKIEEGDLITVPFPLWDDGVSRETRTDSLCQALDRFVVWEIPDEEMPIFRRNVLGSPRIQQFPNLIDWENPTQLVIVTSDMTSIKDHTSAGIRMDATMYTPLNTDDEPIQTFCLE